MVEFKKFSSIEQFRSMIKQVNDHCSYNTTPLPKLKFNGTIKLHGTSACVSHDVILSEWAYQSRERSLSLQQDNNGFMLWASGKSSYFNIIMQEFSPKESIYIFGEWCGGNIQKNVALNNVPKMFVIFQIVVDGIKIDLSKLDSSPEYLKENSIYHVYDFPHYKIEIDFNNTQEAQNKLVEVTLEVEAECPVGKTLLSDRVDYSELNKVGEGLVWYNYEYDLIFKTKGSLHSSSKVKTLKQIASIDIEKMENLKEFVDMVCSPNRLNQGLQSLQEAQLDSDDNKNLGAFIRWVSNDIFKEENDTIIQNQFNPKTVGSEITKVARNFYMNRV